MTTPRSVISLRDVCVHFPIVGSKRSLRHALVSSSVGGLITVDKEKSNQVSIAALENINFDFKDGDRIGLIGPNGAGKTTLLKVLSGIYAPTEGVARINGKVSALFSAGLGMDPEDSGYDNIYTCGLYLGMSVREIGEMIPDIEEFTELGSYLNLPVRTYSSGMMVRLAFAITTAVNPEILLLDEGLGAGDAKFAEKAKTRVDSLVNRARVLVLASHSDELIRKMCSRCLLMESGRVIDDGPTEKILAVYKERRKAS